MKNNNRSSCYVIKQELKMDTLRITTTPVLYHVMQSNNDGCVSRKRSVLVRDGKLQRSLSRKKTYLTTY